MSGILPLASTLQSNPSSNFFLRQIFIGELR